MFRDTGLQYLSFSGTLGTRIGDFPWLGPILTVPFDSSEPALQDEHKKYWGPDFAPQKSFSSIRSTSIAGLFLSAVKVLDIFFVDISRGEISSTAEPGFDSVRSFDFKIAVVVVDRWAVGIDWMCNARNAFKDGKIWSKKELTRRRKRAVCLLHSVE